MSDERLVKLVRDDIGRFLDGRHGHVTYKPIEDREILIEELRKKLVEEAIEYLIDPCEGELADVLEVVFALASRDLEISVVFLDAVRKAKSEQRGGFETGIGMYVYTSPDGEHGHE